MCMQLKKSPSTALYVEGHGCVCMQLKRKSQYSFVRRGAWLYVHAIKKKKKSKYSFVRRGATVCIKYTRVCASKKGKEEIKLKFYVMACFLKDWLGHILKGAYK